jgi:hypothetical protein
MARKGTKKEQATLNQTLAEERQADVGNTAVVR